MKERKKENETLHPVQSEQAREASVSMSECCACERSEPGRPSAASQRQVGHGLRGPLSPPMAQWPAGLPCAASTEQTLVW